MREIGGRNPSNTEDGYHSTELRDTDTVALKDSSENDGDTSGTAHSTADVEVTSAGELRNIGSGHVRLNPHLIVDRERKPVPVTVTSRSPVSGTAMG
jgi:hypothetical protein